jgi:hypothetical protein
MLEILGELNLLSISRRWGAIRQAGNIAAKSSLSKHIGLFIDILKSYSTLPYRRWPRERKKARI